MEITLEEIEKLGNTRLFELISKSHDIHKQFHTIGEIQVCHLISIKTGGCPEDCKYCAQSSRYQTPISATPLMSLEAVLIQAKKAAKEGVTRICLGAAWKEVKDGHQFEKVLEMISAIATLGVEVCCTLGSLKAHQAEKLKKAGLYAYNHNLDTSEKFYKTIITTRTYQDRLNTLSIVDGAHLTLCCGAILGLGETKRDRLELLHTLCTRDRQPESTPINLLSQIPGTPLEHQPKIPFWDALEIIAMARILMPKTMIRLSSGRAEMSNEQQTLCFFAGANSIFSGEKLLTIANTPRDEDEKLFKILGLKKRPAYATPACTN